MSMADGEVRYFCPVHLEPPLLRTPCLDNLAPPRPVGNPPAPAWIGLARYQLLVGKPHPVTAPIARMHPDDQDAIDDFLEALAVNGLSLKGQFLEKLVALGIARCQNPTEQEVTELLPAELLRLAKAWRKDPDGVLASLTAKG